jgi:hypothetical protein
VGISLPYANGPHGSRSSQDIGTLSPLERNPETFSISSQHSARSSSVLSLPISFHGSHHALTLPIPCVPPYCQLQATVLLGANMGFLFIQSVDANGSRVKNRSPAQIAIYVSIVLSLGSIIMSLLLVGEDLPETKEEVVCISWICHSAFQLINFLFYQGMYLGYLGKRRHNIDTEIRCSSRSV